MKATLSALISSMALVALADEAQSGAITTYTDRTTFNASIAGPVVVEEFTSSSHLGISTGTLNSETNLPAINLFPGDILPGVTYSVPINPAPLGYFFNIDTSSFFDGGFLNGLRGNDPNATLTVSFDNPVREFGFDTNNLMGSVFDLVVVFDEDPDYSAAVSVANTTDLQFFGYESSATDIVEVRITGNADNNDFALDNFTFTVPEPPMASILAVGVVGLLWYARRAP